MCPGSIQARAGLGVAALVAIVCGCGYGFSSSVLPGHIKTVAVPLMENRSVRGGLETALTDSLVEGFIRNHTLSVVPEKNADSALQGAILEYRREPFSVDANENVQEYKVEILVAAQFVDLRNNKVLWEEPRISQWATYNFIEVAGRPAETENDGIGRALAKLTADILNRTVEGW
jgi:hypothetical protein